MVQVGGTTAWTPLGGDTDERPKHLQVGCSCGPYIPQEGAPWAALLAGQLQSLVGRVSLQAPPSVASSAHLSPP